MTPRTGFFAALWLWLFAGIALAASPDMASALVKDTSQRMIKTLEQRRAEVDRDQTLIYKLVGEILVPHFDFEGITQSAVGRYWADATTAQRQTLTVAFQELLVRTYAKALLRYTGQEIRFLPVRPGPSADSVTVSSQVIQAGGPPLAIDYKLHLKGGAWKIHDVAIDGVSLMTNYRSDFAAKIRQGGIDGLVQRLNEMNRKVSGAG
jgi:phospholipid transport system substrate-binding protein